MGRYMRCAAEALIRHAGPDYRISVLRKTGTPRYTDAEDVELLAAAHKVGADLIHSLDYRIPITAVDVPIIATVHDVMRIRRPEFCDSDQEFQRRFGPAVFAELRARTARLRARAELPPGLVRAPQSIYEEQYARMLGYSCANSVATVTPTRTVARQLTEAIGPVGNIITMPWGIDHADVEAKHVKLNSVSTNFAVPARYLLYVGQARPHKGLPVLIDAYRRSRAAEAGVTLVCVGRDFDSGKPGADLLRGELASNSLCVGSVSDEALEELYENAVALVHLAEHEGFGFPPLEALSAGCAVIAADIPVLHETMGEHAIYVDYSDADAAAAAIDEVLMRPADAESRAARRSHAARFTWQEHAAGLLALYDIALAR